MGLPRWSVHRWMLCINKRGHRRRFRAADVAAQSERAFSSRAMEPSSPTTLWSESVRDVVVAVSIAASGQGKSL
jgi:hypothetical protein